MTLLNEWLITHITAKSLFPTVYVLMPLQSTLNIKWLISGVQRRRFIGYSFYLWNFCERAVPLAEKNAAVRHHVLRSLISLHKEHCILDMSQQNGRSPMYELMILQSTVVPEWLTTHITAKWLFLPVYALMCLQITLWSLNDLLNMSQQNCCFLPDRVQVPTE
jgi:hypothetical protein